MTDYLAKELNVDSAQIRTTLLKPAMSVPENAFSKAKSLSIWPPGIRVREYVFNHRGNTVSISKEIFLSKQSSHTAKERTTTRESVEIIEVDETRTQLEPTATAHIQYADRTNLIQLTEEAATPLTE